MSKNLPSGAQTRNKLLHQCRCAEIRGNFGAVRSAVRTGTVWFPWPLLRSGFPWFVCLHSWSRGYQPPVELSLFSFLMSWFSRFVPIGFGWTSQSSVLQTSFPVFFPCHISFVYKVVEQIKHVTGQYTGINLKCSYDTSLTQDSPTQWWVIRMMSQPFLDDSCISLDLRFDSNI